jgi:multiple sugar transport system ATP-binding protein
MGTRIAVLKDGMLQQVGSPLEVYERPRNVFVATFIGTPPMNFIPGEVEPGGAALRAAGFTVPLPGALHAAASRAAGRRALAGVRPEHLHLADGDTPPGRHRLDMEVEMVELLGNEAVIHVRIGDILLVAKTESQRAPRSGSRIALDLEIDALHLFDEATEQRLES